MSESAEPNPALGRRELILLLTVWLLLATITICSRSRIFPCPGFYYDEAVFAGLAKDFVTDQLQKSGVNVEITPHLDRQNEVAFYTIRFRSQ